MTIRHHPDDATLMSFAAGTLPQAFAAVVAAHLELCPRCRSEVAALDLVGAALMDTLPPRPLLRDTPAPPAQDRDPGNTKQRPRNAASLLPWPLRQLVGDRMDNVPWQPLARGLWHHPIPLPGGSGGTLRLLKAAPACTIPEHGHRGAEMTLVLQGAYRDATGSFSIGDVADLDDTLEHTPVADAEAGCICVLATEMPPRFKGLLLRLAQPFLKF
jgi:putative transcriptional regulator